MDAVKEKLVLENIALVYYVVNGLGIKDEYEDIVQIGKLGLIKAANTYNVDREIKFITYAVPVIRNQILMYFRNYKKRWNEISTETSIYIDKCGNTLSLGDTLADSKSIDDDLMKECELTVLRDALKKLTDRERTIVSLMYGLNGRKMTQSDIAKQFNISQSYVSRINRAALNKLKKYIDSR